MNVAKLHYVASTVAGEMKDSNLPSLVGNLAAHLEQSITQPNEETANQYRDTLQSLKDAADGCDSNSFTPSEREILSEMSGDRLTGQGLVERVQEVLNEEAVTPGRALKRLTAINTQVNTFYKSVNNLLAGFESLKVEYDTLGDDEHIVGYTFRGVLGDRERRPGFHRPSLRDPGHKRGQAHHYGR